MKIYKIDEILSKLKNCIDYKLPFSHIRFGDGGIKLLHALHYNDFSQILGISKREGIPLDKITYVCELWGYYARRADFIDTPEVYYNGEFWPRLRSMDKQISDKTLERLLMWPELYYNFEFDNNNFCNPESNYLMVLKNNNFNLLDLIKDKKVCLITAKPHVRSNFRKYGFDVDIVTIVSHYQNHYEKSFIETVNYIKSCSKDYDLWLIAAGELGRLYTGIIKENGGRAVDIGFIAEFWTGLNLHPRLRLFMERNPNNFMEIVLTDEGKKYERFI
jgi:hypothetical protein